MSFVNQHTKLLDLLLLRSHDTVEAALKEFRTSFSSTDFELLLDSLLSRPHDHSTELVLSAMNDGIPLFDWIIERFPSTPEEYVTSFAFKLLSRLSVDFLSLRVPILYSREYSDSIIKYRRFVESAPNLLTMLSSMTFSDTTSELFVDDGQTADFVFAKKAKSQRDNKQSRRKHLSTVVDYKAFEVLGYEIPENYEQAKDLTSTILRDQKAALQFYLLTLRLPDVVNDIKKAYILEDTLSNIESYPDDEIAKSTALEDPPMTQSSSAYPMVQPMKAALYFDSAEGFGEWRILISTGAEKNLREARRTNAKVLKVIVKKIKELSKGHFSNDNQKRLNSTNTDIPIYEAKMTRDSRLVYQIDCIPDYDSDVECQVIRIFGIYTHAQLNHRRVWDSLGHQLGCKGKEYRRRCIFRNRPLLTGDNVVLPASFPCPVESESLGHVNIPELPSEDLDEIHSLLVLEKFIPFSQVLLKSILADLDVAHVFNVTPQERKIIEHTGSCYVLGRSGTGKTTTMLFKMLGMERACELRAAELIRKPRQVFVTQSRVLANKVEEFFSKLLESLSTAARSDLELIALAKEKKENKEEEGLIDLEDDVNWRNDLPARFSQLKDENFPLFITFERLCELLESDVNPGETTQEMSRAATFSTDSVDNCSSDRKQEQRRSFVTYDKFLGSYWPHFSQNLTKGLDPSLVFSEFMGVIKGSEEACCSTDRFLDRQSYERLSHRTKSTFASYRSNIYSIFQLYLKEKQLRSDYDAADRTHSILTKLQEQGIPGQKIDYLYVDEAQDNLLIDALLLRGICRNADGLFWAGDTAQTISVGSSFRFNDLKAFMHNVEENQRESNLHSDTPLHAEEPQTFQLTTNYRSHGGIVNCAHSVISLITKFWPYSIDILARERGVVGGLKPVFFSRWDKDTVRYEQFLFGSSGNHIEFGAQQCILVRDDNARKKLRQQIGWEIGLILTLYESKGLEFNDVLLYNFFEDSTADVSQWRVVLNAIENQEKISAPAPQFDEKRHASICSELKFLYVAITRARKNMWIIDRSDKGEPMRLFWTSKDQVQNCTPGTDVPHLAVSSSPEEWKATAVSLFQHKRYLQAMHCFERASLTREVAVARAYYLREQARGTVSNGSAQAISARRDAFLATANAFIDCGNMASLSKEKHAYFRNAASCFEECGNDRQAAMAYEAAEEFDSAAKVYRRGGMFDEAVQIVKAHQAVMNADVVENIIDIARLFYFTRRGIELDIYVKKANEVFASPEEALEYLEDRGLDVVHATLLETWGRLADAANLHLSEGRTLEAIALFLRDRENDELMQRGVQCILHGLWQNLSFGVAPDKENMNIYHLLELAGQLNTTLLEKNDRDEISMFQAIASGESASLQRLGKTFYQAGNHSAALLCLDRHFINPPTIQVMDLQEVADSLCVFTSYTRLLQDFALNVDHINDSSVHKLFAVKLSTENEFLIPPGTFLYNEIITNRHRPFRYNDTGAFASDWELSRLIKDSLCKRLLTKILAENDMCHKARAFSPCIPFIFGTCNRPGCNQDHVPLSNLNSHSYNTRVRIHLQQIIIFHTLRSLPVEPGYAWLEKQRYWINMLHEALYPPSYVLGTPYSLEMSRIPEAARGFQVVNDWVQNLVFTLNPCRSETGFLTLFIRAVQLGIKHDEKRAIDYIPRAPCLTTLKPRGYLRQPGGHYIVGDLFISLKGSETTTITTGMLFVRHVILNKLPMNISILCDFIDYLCGSLVVSMRYNPMTILHNVTLPRSWILSLCQPEPKKKDVALGLLNGLIDTISDLLEQIYSRLEDHLLFENRELRRLPIIISNIFIARICKTLCIMGYNIPNPILRYNIQKATTSLRKTEGRLFSYHFKSYVMAQCWDQLARLVQQSTAGSPMDEMIQLCHKSRFVDSSRSIKGVRTVVFSSVEEIGALLEVPSAVHISTLRAEAEPFVPNWMILKENADVKGQVTSEPPVDAEEPNDGDDSYSDVEEFVMPETVDSEALMQSADTPQSWTVIAPSDVEIQAASRIQSLYRCILSRRQGEGPKTGLIATRSSYSVACFKAAQELEWPNRYYRLLFLGPLPHILLCIHRVETCALALKGKTKKRLSNPDHRELDELNLQWTKLNGILKEAKRLQGTLGPQSDLHRRRDIQKLKENVRKVDELVKRLPSVIEELEKDLAIGLKGIVVERQIPKKKPKPELQVGDCLDDMYVGY